ncbi:hypothetical protein [Paraburkholderia sp. CNPSo 3281]|uniref:hypothetical protein n=1 Tax=Paraburkholderia sp. CNPSo 3281 TaxID=2940933 RepID=UPI0020B64F3F|nr:hypothetical protein [Paraburkholderia sp. CNPSo 3281]MCP3716437.1 hypothetical protein [Paraburkholderia sp. CNPSo 3281]
MLRKADRVYEFKTLYWNVNTVSSYLRSNARTLSNNVRPRKGMPTISRLPHDQKKES